MKLDNYSGRVDFTLFGHCFGDKNYIDNNFYYLSDSMAGKIARKCFHDGLPKHGYERKIHEDNGATVWIKRTCLSFWKGKNIKRGWCWAIQKV